MSGWEITLLFLAGGAAGWVDSIAGGGGLITLPALLWIGLPPTVALGTNKLQSSFGSATASLRYLQAGSVRLADCRTGMILTAIGAVAGVLAVQALPASFLQRAIPYLLITIAGYMLVSPSLGRQESRPRLGTGSFYLLAGPALGFYDGFFGPGVGSFWVMAIMVGLGYSITRATGTTKLMNFTSNVVSMILFAWGGHVYLLAGLVMAVGEILGARLGAGMVITRGARLVRPMLIIVSLAITVKLLFSR